MPRRGLLSQFNPFFPICKAWPSAISYVFAALALAYVSAGRADESVWADFSLASARSLTPSQGVQLPTSFRALSVDTRTLSDLLDTSGRGRAATTRISLPHPKGGFEVADLSLEHHVG